MLDKESHGRANAVKDLVKTAFFYDFKINTAKILFSERTIKNTPFPALCVDFPFIAIALTSTVR